MIGSMAVAASGCPVTKGEKRVEREREVEQTRTRGQGMERLLGRERESVIVSVCAPNHVGGHSSVLLVALVVLLLPLTASLGIVSQ